MKILFVNSPRFDYSQDLAYSGLVNALGASSVRDYPLNFSYRLPTRSYPKNLGSTPGFSPFALAGALAITPENADLVIVGSIKPDAFRTYLAILGRIPLSVPVFLVDGGDRGETGGDLYRLGAGELWERAVKARPFNIIFKREYLRGTVYPQNVKPFPLSANLSALSAGPAGARDKDVTFWAMNSHPVREKAFGLLKGKFDCDANGTGPAAALNAYRYRGRRYHLELSGSRISVSLRGGGWDTMRYWEIPALGVMMITTRPGIEIPYDFEDRKHAVRCKDDLSDLVELCEYYLAREEERERIARAGREHLLKYHTNEARAGEILREAGKFIKKSSLPV